jgi:hypothetical protein
MEIALSAAAAACNHVSDIAKRSEKKVSGNSEELRRELMTALLVMNLSESKAVKRTKPVKKRTTELQSPPVGRIRLAASLM